MQPLIFILGLAVMLVLGPFSPVEAIPALQFDDQNVSGGTLSYNGSGGGLVGSGIQYDVIQSNADTLSNPNTSLVCLGCEANFTTGVNTAEGDLNAGSFDFAGAISAFIITGSVPQLGIVNEVLLVGDIDSANLGASSIGGLNFFADFVLGDAILNPTLAAYFDLSQPMIMAHTDQGVLTGFNTTTRSFDGVNANSDTIVASVAAQVSAATPFTLLVDLFRWLLA